MLHEKLATFQADFIKDPYRALMWSSNTFSTVATLEVLYELQRNLIIPDSLELAHGVLLDRALSGAQFPPSSTSPIANHLALCRTSAYAEVVKDFFQEAK